MTRTSIQTLSVLSLFALFALGSSSKTTKTDGTGATGSATPTSAATGGDPTKSAKLIGSCDRSDQMYLDCTESYEPSIGGDDKKQCETLGGKFRQSKCPRLKAITQCSEGNAPYLSVSYKYEGAKTVPSADDCARGFKDYKKTPAELTAKSTPVSCNAIATSGSCSQLSALTPESERGCLDLGGEIKDPPEPCPSANGLAGLKLTRTDGIVEQAFYYTTPYKDLSGEHTWKDEDLALICGLAGDKCQHIPFASAPAASAAPAVKGLAQGKPPAAVKAATAPSAKHK